MPAPQPGTNRAHRFSAPNPGTTFRFSWARGLDVDDDHLVFAVGIEAGRVPALARADLVKPDVPLVSFTAMMQRTRAGGSSA